MKTYYKTDKNGMRWQIWKQNNGGQNLWAVLPVGHDSSSIFADAAPTKEEALSLIEQMSNANKEEREKWSKHGLEL
jgi:hypothetical protein